MTADAVNDDELELLLRTILADGQYYLVDSFVAIGQRALERIFDGLSGRRPLPPPTDQRDDMTSTVLAAFARHDLSAFLSVVSGQRAAAWPSVVGALSVIEDDARVIPILMIGYQSESSWDRQNAVGGLSKQRDPRATDALITALRDRSSAVREMAAGGLGNLGDPRAIEPLEEAVKRNRKSVSFQQAAAAALKKLHRAVREHQD